MIWCREVTQELPCPLSLDSQSPCTRENFCHLPLSRPFNCGIYFCLQDHSFLVLFCMATALAQKAGPPVVGNQLGMPWSGPEEHMELPRPQA